MKKCKKHPNCQFKGKGKHNGCFMHGIVDACTNERQELFRTGMLAYSATPMFKPLTKKEKEFQEKCNHELEIARIYSKGSDSSCGLLGYLLFGMFLLWILIKL